MASPSTPSGSRDAREHAAAPSRRHLLTTHGSHAAPPRVVLHLPDLDALSAVALGPTPAPARRRIDPAHTAAPVETLAQPAASSASTATSNVGALESAVKFLRGPVTKLVPQLAAHGGTIGKVIVLLQQPRMMLAAVVAVGLQLAAVLAMITGSNDADTAKTPAPNADTSVATVEFPPPSADGPIQTPLTYFGGSSSPPPQTLPGLNANDLPEWPSEDAANDVADTTANTPARLGPTTPYIPPRLPTPAPPRAAANGPLPTLPQLTGPAQINSADTTDVAHAKPKARLNGTIKKISTSETTP